MYADACSSGGRQVSEDSCLCVAKCCVSYSPQVVELMSEIGDEERGRVQWSGGCSGVEGSGVEGSGGGQRGETQNNAKYNFESG